LDDCPMENGTSCYSGHNRYIDPTRFVEPEKVISQCTDIRDPGSRSATETITEINRIRPLHPPIVKEKLPLICMEQCFHIDQLLFQIILSTQHQECFDLV